MAGLKLKEDQYFIAGGANKNRKLIDAKWTKHHRNFPIYNDIVLDKITEINIS